jgi:gas vesicle protein
MKKILVGSMFVLMVAVPVFALAEDGVSGNATGTVGREGGECPLFVPPGPNFCPDGKIVSGGLDKDGCQRPPQCVRAGVSPIRQEIRDIRQETRNDIQGERKDLRNEIASGTANLWSEIRNRIASGTPPLSGDELQAFKEKRDAFRDDVKEKIEAFRQSIEAERQDMQARIKAEREAMQQKLQQFRDDKKKQIVERLAQGLNDLNEKIVGQFTDMLDGFDRIIVEASSRADKAEANGKDVSAVRAGITNAQTAIAAARAAVGTQAGKTYPITLTSEDTARTDVSAAKQSLETDLKAVRVLVQTAREAVKNVLQALRQIPGIDSLNFSTSTATNTTP